MEFKHKLGRKVTSETTGLAGVLINRSECLYGCNRYLIQPPVTEAGKVPESWWVDEDDVVMVGAGVTAKQTDNGGPMSRKC